VDLDQPFARLSVRESLVVHAGLSEAESDRRRARMRV
jgi:lysyl-tRNA synthetase class 2